MGDDREPETAQVLDALLQRARAEAPDILVPDDSFTAAAAARLRGRRPDDAESAPLHAGDLLIAYGCEVGDANALRLLQSLARRDIPPALRRLDDRAPFADEIVQLTLERVLVCDAGTRPRIAEYSGRGSLSHWLRAAALRIALNQKEGLAARAPHEGPEALDALAAPAESPELALLKQQYGPVFKEALRAAFSRLEPRERNVLRLYVLERLNIDAIGTVYGVNRSSVGRWIQQARAKIQSATQDELRGHLSLSPSELQSLLQLVQSQLAASLAGYLGAAREPE